MPPQIPHVLVIDDNNDVLEIVEIILQTQKYKVSGLNYTTSVEENVIAFDPTIILLDKRLGWADGCEICQSIKSHPLLKNIPIIMFSAYNNVKEICIDAGADDFIEKPFTIDALLDTIILHTNRRFMPKILPSF